MLLHRLVYDLALVLSCGYALIRGGRPERWGAMILVAGSLLTIPATWFDTEWISTQYPVLIVDLIALAALVALALCYDRFWPLWATGFHLVAVITHLASIAEPTIVPKAYAYAQAFWAYPMMAALVIGTRNQGRATRNSSPY